jgi:hypothetical protein
MFIPDLGSWMLILSIQDPGSMILKSLDPGSGAATLIWISPSGTMCVIGDAVGNVAVWRMAEFCLSDWSQLHSSLYEHERWARHLENGRVLPV